MRRGSGRAGEGTDRTCADPLWGRIKVLQVTAAAHDATPPLVSPRNVLLRLAPTLASGASFANAPCDRTHDRVLAGVRREPGARASAEPAGQLGRTAGAT